MRRLTLLLLKKEKQMKFVCLKEFYFIQNYFTKLKFQDFGDNGIYWCVDYSRFDKYLRDQIIINAFENRIDKVILFFYFLL